MLVGPTIVRYYESFSDKDNIYIVMELADGGFSDINFIIVGSLTDKIKEQAVTKQMFTPDRVLGFLNFLIQLIRLDGTNYIRNNDYAQ